MPRHPSRSRSGFSLIELVIVVVIIGIIGAIAIPRMSQGASGASDSALVGNLSVLRNAIDLYAAEHDGEYPSLANIADQLTQRTDNTGAIDDGTGATGGFVYGPYMRKIPPLPVGEQQGQTAFTGTLDNTMAAGWVYNEETGDISANATATDQSGTAYSTY